MLNNMKKKVNGCAIYVILWCLYYLQGILYAQGGIISQSLLAVLLISSLYFCLKVNMTKGKLPLFMRVLNVFVVMLTIYGIFFLLSVHNVYNDNYLLSPLSKIEFLKSIYISQLPIYAFYYYARKGRLNDEFIRRSIIIIFIVTVCMFFWHHTQEILRQSTNVNVENITNNIAYNLVAILPLFFFVKKSLIMQHVLILVTLLLILTGMKRGAIFVGVVCFLWSVYRLYIKSRGQRRLFVILITTVTVVGVCMYALNQYATNDYFQYRIGQTIDGDSSGRDIIYTSLMDYFMNQTSLVRILFGNGAYHTVRVVGAAAHNDWLELLICHGLIGGVIYVLYYYALLRVFLTSRNNTCHNVLGSVLIIMLLSSIFSMQYNNLFFPMSMCIGWCLASSNSSIEFAEGKPIQREHYR